MKVRRARYATLTGARLHQMERPTWAATFCGFTYAPGNDYHPRHISNLVKHVRRWCEKHGIECRYIWVAEMQKRGVIHYHLLVFHPKRLQFPKPDKQGWWPHGSTNRRTGIKRAVAYMAKYMSKGDTAQYPKGARTYGCGGLQGTAKIEMRWWKLPQWIRKETQPEDEPRRVSHVYADTGELVGGFELPKTGRVLRCPWRVIFSGGSVYLKRVEGR